MGHIKPLQAQAMSQKVAAFLDGVFVKGVGDEVLELGLVEEVFDGEIEGDLLAAGDVRGGLADLMRSVALSATIGDAAGDADVAGDIADSHAELGDFEAAARWYDTCLAAIAAEDGWASEGGGALASSWWDC